ncbi:hypothetical protein [Pantoea sp.]|uniref:hypothetical protein n=1 Tax=Pantoea sp. TaxID=69393 RepID=UPI0031D97FA4
MKLYDSAYILKLAKDPILFKNKFISYLKNDNANVNDALNIIRISGIYYKRNSSLSVEKLNEKMTPYFRLLMEKFPSDNEIILKENNQYKKMCHLYNQFFEHLKINNIWGNGISEKELFIISLFSENFISIYIAILGRTPHKKLKKILPFVFYPSNIPRGDDFTHHDIKTLSRAIDEIVHYTGKIFSLAFSKSEKKMDIDEKISMPDFVKMLDVYESWNRYDSLSRTTDFFRLCNAELALINENELKIEVCEDNLYRDYEVSRSRVMMKSMETYEYLNNYISKKPSFISEIRKWAPSYLTKNDIYHAMLLTSFENISPENMFESYGGISIFDWVHAYEALVSLAIKEHKKRLKRKNKLSNQSNWLIRKSREDWILFFEKESLSHQCSKLLVDYFTFTKESLDINDCPLIPCNDGFFIMPALLSTSSSSRSLLSLFNAKKISTSIKGRFHEDEFISLVNSSGITALNLSSHNDYECDCVIIIDNYIVFVELKSNGQPIFFNKYYQNAYDILGDTFHIKEFSRKKRSFTEQINRYSAHYLTHLVEIRKAFNLPYTWKHEGVIKIIVTTSPLGGKYFANGCYVVDQLSLDRFFKRIKGVINDENLRKENSAELEKYKFCEGKITINKLTGYLESLPSISIFRKSVNKLTYDFNVGEVKVSYPYYDAWPDFYSKQ